MTISFIILLIQYLFYKIKNITVKNKGDIPLSRGSSSNTLKEKSQAS
jgi:hypothetical protein